MNDFEHIVQTASSKTRPDPQTQRLLEWDPRSRTVRPPGGWNLLRSGTTYLVTNSLAPRARYRSELQVQGDQLSGAFVGLRMSIAYEVACVPGEEVRLLRVVAGQANPARVVEDHLKAWIRDRLTQLADVAAIKDLFSALQAHLQLRGREDLGLSVKTRIRLTDGPPADIELDQEIEVRPHDVPDQGSGIRLVARFAPDPQKGLLALRTEPKELEAAVVRASRGFVEQEVDLQALVFATGSMVAPGLRRHLGEVVARYGHTVATLQVLSREDTSKVQLKVPVSHEFTCSVQTVREGVKISSEMRLALSDLGRYRAAGAPDPVDWATRTVERVTDAVLFDASFEQLILGFDPQKAQIRTQMESEAKAIGYQIRQFHAISALQVDQLRKPFQVEVSNEFATRQHKVKAGLELQLTARIPNPDSITDLLKREVDVRAELSKVLAQEMATVIHGVEPEDFFLYFSSKVATRDQVRHGDPYSPREGETLQRRLGRVVRAAAEERFGAEVLSVVFKHVDTEITRRLERVMGMRQKFIVHAQQPNQEHEPVPFSGVLRVTAVDPKGWHNFVLGKPEPDTLVEAMKEALETRLSQVELEELYGLALHEQQDFINAWAKERMGEDFGLVLEVHDWRRLSTEVEVDRGIARRTIHKARHGALLADVKVQEDAQQKDREAYLARIDRLDKELEHIEVQLGTMRNQLSKKERKALEVRRDEILASKSDRQASGRKSLEQISTSAGSTGLLPDKRAAPRSKGSSFAAIPTKKK